MATGSAPTRDISPSARSPSSRGSTSRGRSGGSWSARATPGAGRPWTPPCASEVSQTCGERVLFPAICADRGAAVVAAGYSCRTQIHQATGGAPVHLAHLAAAVLARPRNCRTPRRPGHGHFELRFGLVVQANGFLPSRLANHQHPPTPARGFREAIFSSRAAAVTVSSSPPQQRCHPDPANPRAHPAVPETDITLLCRGTAGSSTHDQPCTNLRARAKPQLTNPNP